MSLITFDIKKNAMLQIFANSQFSLKVIFLSIFLALSSASYSQNVFHEDDFESCTGGFTMDGTNCDWTDLEILCDVQLTGLWCTEWTIWLKDALLAGACCIEGNSLILTDGDVGICTYQREGAPTIKIAYNTKQLDATQWSNLNFAFDWSCVGETDPVDSTILFDYGTLMYNVGDPLTTGDWIAVPGARPLVGQPQVVTEDVDFSFLGGQQFYYGFRWENDAMAMFAPGLVVDHIVITGDRVGPEFSINEVTTCVDASLQLTDESNPTPTSWNWTAVGPGTPTFLPNNTVQNPTVSFDASGFYTVTLTINGGADFITKTSFIEVLDAVQLPFSEDFETGTFTANKWRMFNPDGADTWQISFEARGKDGGATAKIDNWDGKRATKDGLITRPLDFTGYDSIWIDYKHAWEILAQQAERRDTLRVYVSDDCGASWNLILTDFEDQAGTGNFATKAPDQGMFMPEAADDWCGSGAFGAPCKEGLLIPNTFYGSPNSMVMFELDRVTAVNFWFDDVNIYGVKSVVEANFNYTPDTTCLGGEVQFTDTSIEDIVSWNWTFPGATPGTSTDQNPLVVYNTSGSYDVFLEVCNSKGNCDDTTVTMAVFVDSSQALPFFEDFETSDFADNNWSLENPDGDITWEIVTVGGSVTGDKASYMNHYSYNTIGARDYLTTPKLDFRPYIGGSLTFDYAYVGAQDPSADGSDTLYIEVSTDCGESWGEVFVGIEDGSGSFNTQSTDGTAFAPSIADDWCFAGADTINGCVRINLDAYLGAGALQVRFVSGNHNVNNLYIDNILIEGEDATLPITADFGALPRFICEGASVTFTDKSEGGPISWEWTLPGGTPSSSGLQNPVVTYDVAGTYAVGLKVCNITTCDSLTRTGYIVVGDGFSLPLVEDFESGETFALHGWSVSNPDDNISWEQTTVVGSAPGDQALYMNNAAYTNIGARDYLISPPLNFTDYNSVNLSFDHAYQTALTGGSDTLIIEISPDCGTSWDTLLVLSEDEVGTFATSTPAVVAAPFIPAGPEDWCTEGSFGAGCTTINLDAYAGNGGFKIRFQNINGNENNLYLDNINILGVEPGERPEAQFESEYPIGCIDQPIQYTDLSLYNPTFWQWSFEGGTPATSTDRHPVVTYPEAGRYNVSLTVSNSFGRDTLIESRYIEIVEDRTLPFTEDFESGIFSTRDWYVENPDSSNTWTIEEVSGNGPGVRSAKMTHRGYQGAGQYDYMVSPPFDLRGYDTVTMDFRHAYALFSSTNIDSLVISLSADCGSSWDRVTSFYEDGNGSYATRRPLPLSSFVPESSEDWCYDGFYGSSCLQVDLTSAAGKRNVKVRFESYNANGNNVYIDDINITGIISLPTAKFVASPRIVCEGDTVWYTNTSSNNATSFEWTFTAGTPATSTDESPYVVYNTSGQHAVSLRAMNAAGSDERIELNYITVFEVPKFAITLTPASCGENDGEIVLNTTGGEGPYTYEWSSTRPQDTSGVISGIPGGLYTVRVTNQQGCTTIQDIVLPTDGTIQASIVEIVPIDCNNDVNGSMRAIGSGGISPYTYIWNTPNNDSTAAVSNLPAGTYTCVVTDGAGCIVTVSTKLENPDPVTLSTMVVNDNGSSNGSVTVTASGGTPPYSYLWRTAGSETTATISNLTEGTYLVDVTDANGCTLFIESIVIYEPKITIVVEEIIGVSCSSEEDGQVTVSVSGGTYPYTYFWKPLATSPYVDYDSIANNMPVGNYTLTVTDAMGVQKAVTVFVGEESPLILNASATPDNGTENGTASANISGGLSPYSFVWGTSPVQTGATATGLKEGQYEITVTDAVGCTTSKTVTVIGSYQALQAQVYEVRPLKCASDSDGRIEITATGGVPPRMFSWNSNPSQLGPVATSLDGGVYTCTVTDAYGNQVQVTATVTEPLPLVVTVNTTEDNGNGTGTAKANPTGGTAPYTYRWDSNPPQLVQEATGLRQGTYTCVVRDKNDCVKIVTVDVGQIFSITELDARTISVYPNPSTGIVQVGVEQSISQEVKIQVYNHLAQPVYQTKAQIGLEGTIRIDLNSQSKGMYYIELQTEQWNSRHKLVLVD
ncbi:MAG: PKD repeat protein [Flavobacteriales bacterium]